MDAFPSGMEGWSPRVTVNPLDKRRACSDLLLTPIDCGNGACCPRESVCEIMGGTTNCRGTLSNLPGGTAVVPGFTLNTSSSTATASASSSSASTVQSGVPTSSTPSPEPSAVTQTTTAEVSSVSTETVLVLSSSSSSLSSTSTSTTTSGIESITSSLMTATPSPQPAQDANAGSGTTGSTAATNNNNSNNNNSPGTGVTSVGAAVGIAMGVGAIAFIFVLLAFILCVRHRRKKARENQNQQKQQPVGRAANSSDTERGTTTLPRGQEKTFSDVVEAGRYNARRSSRASSARSDPFADQRPGPEMTAIGGGSRSYGSSDRVYDRRSYDRRSHDRRSYDRRSYDRRSYDRGYDRGYNDEAVARSQRDMSDRRTSREMMTRPDSVSTARTSRLFPPEEDMRYYDNNPPSPPPPLSRRYAPSGPEQQQRRRQSRNYEMELDVPEPAATYLRDPFANPDPRTGGGPRQKGRSGPASAVASSRSASPRRYLYPEQTDRDLHEEGDQPEGPRAESRADSDRSQPRPLNYLPVFQQPVYAILPGSSGAVVEMI